MMGILGAVSLRGGMDNGLEFLIKVLSFIYRRVRYIELRVIILGNV